MVVDNYIVPIENFEGAYPDSADKLRTWYDWPHDPEAFQSLIEYTWLGCYGSLDDFVTSWLDDEGIDVRDWPNNCLDLDKVWDCLADKESYWTFSDDACRHHVFIST